jgi:hypothetical protein
VWSPDSATRDRRPVLGATGSRYLERRMPQEATLLSMINLIAILSISY